MNTEETNLLLGIYKEVKNITTKSIPKIEKQLEEIPVIKKQLEEIPVIKKQLEEIPAIKKQLEEIPKMKEELRRISGTVARIEADHGEKLMALFDVFKIHSEKFVKQDERIKNIEKQLQKHDDILYFLNQKIQKE